MAIKLAPGKVVFEPVVFDPRGIVETEARPLAARRKSLAGLRLGVLDNTKWNADRLLRETAALLGEAHGFEEVTFYKKESFAKYAAPELIEEMAAHNDLVLTAVGD